LLPAVEAAPQVVQYKLNLLDNFFNRAKFERDLGNAAAAEAITKVRDKLLKTLEKNGNTLSKQPK
jgi:hypothetical protein